MLNFKKQKNWLVMKFVYLLTCAFLVNATASVYSQNTQFTFSVDGKTIKEVFRMIEKESQFRFLYNDDFTDLNRTVSIDVVNNRIESILDEMLSTLGITYRILENNLIVITPVEYAARQGIAITGTVLDNAGESLPGVSVLVKGSTTGTTTNAQGVFTINVPDRDAVLVFTFVGYTQQEVVVGINSVIDITMSESVGEFDELVIVGYGVQRRINLSGAVDHVSARQLEVKPIVNLAHGLQGMVPNLNIEFAGGRPGAVARLNIRGMTSINDGNPLILIDGVSSDPEDLNRLAPGDVEEISVLKDASSAAIYGARAAYGVILVRTRTGRTGQTDKVRVVYTSNMEWTTPTILPKKVSDPYIYARLKQNSVDATPWSTQFFTSEQFLWAKERSDDPSIPAVRLSTRDNTLYEYMGGTDWIAHYMDRYLFANNNQLSISGGSEKISYFVSANYAQEKGSIPVAGDSFTRYGMRSNFGVEPWKFLNVSVNTSYITTIQDYPAYINDWWDLYEVSPTEVDKNPNGTWANTNLGILMAKFVDGGKWLDRKDQFTTTFELKGKIIENVLDVTANYTYRRNDQDYRWNNKTYSIGFGPDDNRERGSNYVSRQFYATTYQAFNIFTNFNQLFGLHRLSGVVGFNQEWQVYDGFRAERDGLISSDLPSLTLAEGDRFILTDSYSDWAIRGLFGRLNYTFNDKYILEFNGRYDGSSRFPYKSRFGFFPSASAAWRVEQEKFMDWSSGWLSQLKLRASYGSLGNQASSNYGYIDNMSVSRMTPIIGGQQRMLINVPPLVSARYTWETVTTINGGIDIGFFNHKFFASLDIYRRDTKNMLTAARELPAILGASAPRENAADLKTTGFELTLRYHDTYMVNNKPLDFSAKFILSDSRSFITRFDNPTKQLGQYYEGYEIGELWGLVNDGFFRSADEIAALDQSAIVPWGALPIVNGWPRYKDLDENYAIEIGRFVDDPKDVKIIGNTEPRFRFGVTMGANWNGFDMHVFVQGIIRRQYYPAHYLYWGLYQQPYTGVNVHLLDFYRDADDIDISGHSQSYINAGLHLQNHDAKYPVLQSWLADVNAAGRRVPDAQGLAIPQTDYLLNAGYIRLKNLTVGYTLPDELTRKIAIDRFRIYVSGENLFEISEVKPYFDPEAINDRTDAYAYPFRRKYIVGLNITF